MTMIDNHAYDDAKRAINDVMDARDQARTEDRRNGNGNKWPQWAQTVLAVGAVIVTIVLAYATLDKRISLLEQKIDYIVQKVR